MNKPMFHNCKINLRVARDFPPVLRDGEWVLSGVYRKSLKIVSLGEGGAEMERRRTLQELRENGR